MPQQEQIDKLSKKDCIENIKLFKLVRKRDVSIQIAVSDKKKNTKILYF